MVSSIPLKGTPVKLPPFGVSVIVAVEPVGANTRDVMPKAASLCPPRRLVIVPLPLERTVPPVKLGATVPPPAAAPSLTV